MEDLVKNIQCSGARPALVLVSKGHSSTNNMCKKNLLDLLKPVKPMKPGETHCETIFYERLKCRRATALAENNVTAQQKILPSATQRQSSD